MYARGPGTPASTGDPRRLLSRAALVAALALLIALGPIRDSQGAPPAIGALAAVPRDERFGIAHISYGTPATPGDLELRHAQAADAGARWNRWVIYWTDVETSAGVYDYSRVDTAVDRSQAWGFKVNAVLLGTPSQYATAGSLSVPPPRVEDKAAAVAYLEAQAQGIPVQASSATSVPSGLHNATFADGTDVWAAGKAINPGNPWARFVNETVRRYQGRVGLWEIWNEPDFSQFWSGSVADYVRLLKVGYLAAKAADPAAKVAVGGMMYWEKVNQTGQSHAWLRSFLGELNKDSQRGVNGHYFDVIPWHWYSRPSDVYWRTTEARTLLSQHGISGKALWVNESNAPACGEPPLNVSCSDPAYRGSATVEEQAAFVVQAAAYALAADVAVFFVFQHYDDGVGEAYGLFRNDGSARPVRSAYQVAVSYLGGATSATRSAVGDYEKVVVETKQGESRRQATVVWKRTPGDGMLGVPGSGTATLVSLDGTTQQVSASGGAFAIPLRGATNNRSFNDDPNDYIVGGVPRILVTSPSSTAPTSGGLLTNGSFESGSDCVANASGEWGPTGWGCGGSTAPLLSGQSLRGSRSVLLGSGFVADPFVGGGSNSTVSQAVTLPSGGSPVLQFAYRMDTAEERPANVGDWSTWPDRFEAIVVDARNQPHYALVEWASAGWRWAKVDLSPYSGTRVVVTFNLYQSSGERPTSVYVDEATVWASQVGLPVIRR